MSEFWGPLYSPVDIKNAGDVDDLIKSMGMPAFQWYVLGPRENVVHLYNGTGSLATFPLDKFLKIKPK